MQPVPTPLMLAIKARWRSFVIVRIDLAGGFLSGLATPQSARIMECLTVLKAASTFFCYPEALAQSDNYR
jgi:hypothetical protein